MAGRLRILTANLWDGRADPEAFAALVEREQVDVACVQELTPEQARPLAAALPHGALEPARDSGLGIALRRPAELTSLPLRHRPLRTARLEPKDWPGLSAPLEVWNVHVCAPHSFSLRVPWRVRRAQIRDLLQHLRGAGGQGRLLLVGDFNASPLWPVYRRVAREIDDAALAHARGAGRRAPRTWGPDWPGVPRVRLLRIDHAFARGVRVTAVRTLDVQGSDHDALCVDLALD